jgi:hypothetical protein
MSSKQSGGHSHAGRDKVKCARYRARNTRMRNKISKLNKYCRAHINDKQAQSRLGELRELK